MGRPRDHERITRIRAALREKALDALVCALPHNVLLLSGYWPVVGLSLAVVTREGQVVVIAPEDEKEFALHGWGDEIRTFAAASLDHLATGVERASKPLAQVARDLRLGPGTAVGYESDETSVPAPYVAMHLYGPANADLLKRAMPGAILHPSSDLLKQLRSVLTAGEVDRLRTACRIGERAFTQGTAAIHSGAAEPEVANAVRSALSLHGKRVEGVDRADGSAWCMSGPNSAEAYKAFAHTRSRSIEAGDLVMIHCNSFADGYWTDITRTFSLGQPDKRQRAMHNAVFEARKAALNAIRPGARGSEVDHAARQVMEAHGFGKDFKHPLGHGVGFAAISHDAKPRLHPASPDVLEPGMVFNVEPAAYLEGYGGVRHCDVVTVTEHGSEVLTPFQASLDELVLSA